MRCATGLLLLLTLAGGCRKQAPIEERVAEPPARDAASPAEDSVQIATLPTQPTAGQQTTVSLRIGTRADGEIHLVAVNRDLTWYEHLHPKLNGETYDATLAFPRNGEYVLHAIVRPLNKPQLVRRRHITVGGGAAHAPRPIAVSPRETRDGAYTIRLRNDPEPPAAGIWNSLIFSISRDGDPVTNLTPPGMTGHMVILREGGEDFVYAHFTDGEALRGVRGRAHLPALPRSLDDHRRHTGDTGPEVTFHTTFPQVGRYKIWVEFLAGGEPIRADFVVDAGKAPPPPPHRD